MKRWLTVLLCVLIVLGETGCAKRQENEIREQNVIISVLAGQSTSDAGVEDMIDEWMQKIEAMSNDRVNSGLPK